MQISEEPLARPAPRPTVRAMPPELDVNQLRAQIEHAQAVIGGVASESGAIDQALDGISAMVAALADQLGATGGPARRRLRSSRDLFYGPR